MRTGRPASASAEQRPSIATIEFAYEHLEGVLELQVRDDADLDLKTAQVFSAGTI